jgi:hypothetical protein
MINFVDAAALDASLVALMEANYSRLCFGLQHPLGLAEATDPNH